VNQEQNQQGGLKTMNNNRRLLASLLLLASGLAAGTAWASTGEADAKMVERGRYIARVAGCNDCHTPGYALANGSVPENLWLTGDTLGWRGPWGTTYGPNLRLYLGSMTEDEWVKDAKTLKRRPPMPWFNLNHMSDDDLRALYHFVKYLGDPGKPAPAYVPPDREPSMPYVSFPSPPPAK
jgi:mono/diheme cytochrome c family protein